MNVVTTETDYPLDGAADFHNLATNYVGSFTTTSLVQLSGAEAGRTGTGLHFAADLQVPEPASLALVGAGGLLFLRRKNPR